MKINLRKASALSAEIRNAAKNVSTEVSFSANLYSDNIQATAENMRVTLMENIVRKDRLDAVARAIRGLVGRANAEAGIATVIGILRYSAGASCKVPIELTSCHPSGITASSVMFCLILF